MQAVIDVGSNTVRLLIGGCNQGVPFPKQYQRQTTRLAGGISVQNLLSKKSMDRTLVALKSFKQPLSDAAVIQTRVVGTATLRRATNRQTFINQVKAETGFNIEVIDGLEEARLMSIGVLSVINPVPEHAIIIDIGGGSTELVCLEYGDICFQVSYPLGVVRLCEELQTDNERKNAISSTISQFSSALAHECLLNHDWQLIGTAGTITTLAAIDLGLDAYDAEAINNHDLSFDRLSAMLLKLTALNQQEREKINGMEAGRGDLILPGLDIVLQLMSRFKQRVIRVSDYGLLEGALIDLNCSL